MAAGALFTASVLSKPSALFLLPALVYLVWCNQRGAKLERQIQRTLIPLITLGLILGLYWIFYSHNHQIDILTLKGQNAMGLQRKSVEKAVRLLYRAITWVDPLLVPLVYLLLFVSFKWLRALWSNPLFGCAVIWALGYAAFTILRLSGPPRYFTVMAPALLLILFLGVQETTRLYPKTGIWVTVWIVAATVWNVSYIFKLMSRPTYTMRVAYQQVQEEIHSHPETKQLVIGHGAIMSTFFTGIPALDDISSAPMEEKLDRYHPGWALVWKDNADLLQKQAILDRYRPVLVHQYNVFEDPARTPLMLFRLDSK